MNRPCHRGEIYYADLNPIKGHEQGGRRPVLVIQNDIGNQYSPTTIIAPLTTAFAERVYPTVKSRLSWATCSRPSWSTV